MFKQSYAWMCKQVHSPYASFVLGSLSFIEATIFFIPIDPLLVLYCIEQRHRCWYYAFIATSCSVIGGLFGYLIGMTLWQTLGSFIVSHIISPDLFAQAVELFKRYQAAAVLIAGFTPIPYKAATIGAGFCHLPLTPFIICSIISRGARFYLLAGIIYVWGDHVGKFIDRYFNILVITFTILIMLGVWMIKLLR